MSELLRSPVGLGTAPIGSLVDGPLWWGPQDEETSIETIIAAIETGIDWIDTAAFYGWGHAERIVGRALARAPRPVRVLTKCGTVRTASGAIAENASPDSIRAGARESLERLGLSLVDVLQVHDPDPNVPIEETWEAMMGLVDDGLIGGAGLSNHSLDLMERALRVGPIATVQQQYSLLWRNPEQDGVIEWCAERGIPFLAWSPLASGFLTDGFDLERLDPRDLRRNLRWATGDGAAHVTHTRDALRRVAARHETTLVRGSTGMDDTQRHARHRRCQDERGSTSGDHTADPHRRGTRRTHPSLRRSAPASGTFWPTSARRLPRPTTQMARAPRPPAARAERVNRQRFDRLDVERHCEEPEVDRVHERSRLELGEVAGDLDSAAELGGVHRRGGLDHSVEFDREATAGTCRRRVVTLRPVGGRSSVSVDVVSRVRCP